MIPAAKEDDPEEVSDKLSIAAAMWARGEKNDALSWLRRAAESASDADADMRALELAKAASALSDAIAGAPPSASKVEAAKPAAPTKPTRPPTAPPSRPGSARPGGKLPPLPPIRPLGAAPPPPRSRPPDSRASQPKAPVAAAATPPPPSKPASAAAIAPIHEPEDDDEKTSQIEVSPQLLAQSSASLPPSESTPVAAPVDQDESDLKATMRREADAEPSPAADKSHEAEGAHDRATPIPVAMPLAVGMHVRLVPSEDGVRVVLDSDSNVDDGGIPVIIVPTRRDDDLRTLLYRIKR